MPLALFFATLVGLSLGLFGGGGSLLSVAILSFALGMPPKAAMTASLFVTGVTSTAALLAQRDRRLVSARAAGAFGGVGMLGAFAGGRLATFIPEAALLTGFGVVVSLTSIAMLRFKPGLSESESRAPEARWAGFVCLLGLALGIGTVTGLLGAGGGFLIVPALVLHERMPMPRAVATSLVVTALQSFAGFLGHLGHASLAWAVVAPFTLMATLGSVVGSVLAKRAPQALLRRGFAGLALLLALAIVVRELRTFRAAPTPAAAFVDEEKP